MRRSEWSRILIEGRPELLRELAQAVADARPVRVERPPQRGLVMLKAREGLAGQPFFLGEALVTECAVRVGDTPGFGMLLGEEPERAYHLAVVDAAFAAGLPEVADWLPRLRAEAAAVDARQAREFALHARSRVDFATVGDDHVSR